MNFNGPAWLWLTLPLLLLPLFFIWPVASPNRLLRSALTLVAGLSLLAMGLEPEFNWGLKPPHQILLTRGWQQAGPIPQVSSGSKIFAMPDAEEPLPAAAVPIPDFGFLMRQFDQAPSLHLIGFGLDEGEWLDLTPTALSLQAAPQPPGFSFLQWPEQIEAGQMLSISGTVSGLEPGSRLELIDPGGASSLVPVSPEGAFHFSDQARSRGRFSWTLRVLDQGNQEFFRRPLNIEIIDPAPIKVLILEGSPNPDTRFIEAWLARIGASYLTRTQISRDRWRWEKRNTEPFRVLDRQVLQAFDLVIIDPRALAGLGEPEFDHLSAEMRDSGLGLFLRAEPELRGEGQRFKDLFRWRPLEITDGTMATPNLGETATAINILPFELVHQPGQMTLVTDKQDRILASAVDWGRGRIATALVVDSYFWVQTGQDTGFQLWWQAIFGALARPRQEGMVTEILSAQPYRIDQPMVVGLSTPDPAPELTLSPGGSSASPPEDAIPLTRDASQPHHYLGTYRPIHTGPHRIGETVFFVYDSQGWDALNARSRLLATQTRVLARASTLHEARPDLRKLPFWWLLAIFALAMSGLWLEAKVRSLDSTF